MRPTQPVVLVVEDDPTINLVLVELLEGEGYDVIAAANGRDALEHIAAGGIDLILLDLMLPDLDGLEVCRVVRAAEGGVALPILILTARGHDQDVTAGFAAGADDYIVKPFNAPELLARVHVWARTHQRLQVNEALGLLAAIVTCAEDAIFGKTLDGVITSWNPAAERLYGYTAAEAIGQSAVMLIPPERQPEFWRVMDAIRQGDHVEHDETVRLRKDGQRMDVSVCISPVRNAAGRLLGAATIARNITARKRAEASLRQALRREGQLQGVLLAARELAHLVNNDLVVPVGALEVLQYHPDLPPGLRDLLDEAMVALLGAAQHVQQFQRVVRVEIKNTPVGPSLDLARSVERV
jgi:PAS domain S-box-containing protein